MLWVNVQMKLYEPDAIGWVIQSLPRTILASLDVEYTVGLPASRNYLLCRASKFTSVRIEDLENLVSLRSFLQNVTALTVEVSHSSRYCGVLPVTGIEQGKLTRFSNIRLCTTSHISATPLDCKALKTSTLEAAHHTLYRIYKHGERFNSTKILERLDFHPLFSTGRLLQRIDVRRSGQP